MRKWASKCQKQHPKRIPVYAGSILVETVSTAFSLHCNALRDTQYAVCILCILCTARAMWEVHSQTLQLTLKLMNSIAVQTKKRIFFFVVYNSLQCKRGQVVYKLPVYKLFGYNSLKLMYSIAVLTKKRRLRVQVILNTSCMYVKFQIQVVHKRLELMDGQHCSVNEEEGAEGPSLVCR